MAVKIAGAALAATLALGGVGCANNQTEAQGQPKTHVVTRTPKPTFTPQPTATEILASTSTPTAILTPKPTETLVPTATPTEAITEQNIDGTKVVYRNGIPWYYELQGGRRGDFDQEEMIRVREKAITEKESQVAVVFEIPKQELKDTTVPSEDRPLLSELPADVLSKESLEERGVTVINGNVELYIRESAFEDGGPFAEYRVGGDRRLIIVIVDEPFFTPHSLDDKRYDKVRAIGELAYQSLEGEAVVSPEEFRRQELAKIEKMTAEAKEKEYGKFEVETLTVSKMMIESAGEEVLKKMIAERDSGCSGVMVPSKLIEECLGIKETTMVLVCAGKSDVRQIGIIKVDDFGNFTMDYSSWTYSGPGRYVDLTPKVGQSRPRPGDFTVTEGEEYMVTSEYQRSPGFNLWHELMHNQRIELSPTGDPLLDRNEWLTDRDALERIKQSYESGKYHFFFYLPDRDGYILTKNEVEKDSGVLT